MPPELLGLIQPWMVQFAFWASLTLTIIKVFEVIRRATLQPRLDLRLTRETFFRLIDAGEVLFCNAVFLARNGAILVCNTTATLKKIDPPEKTFPMKVIAFGEKVRGAGPLADFFFHSTSPLAHIPEANPQRAVYLCVQDKYQDRTHTVIAKFRKEVQDYKARLEIDLGQDPNPSTEVKAQILRAINSIVDTSTGEMMDIVQLEPGRYELTLQIEYQKPSSRLLNRKRQIDSRVSFRVDDGVRDLLRSSLRNTLAVSASNIILGQSQNVLYPEYQPLEVTEL